MGIKILWAFAFGLFVMFGYLCLKMDVATHKRHVIMRAILEYHLDCIEKHVRYDPHIYDRVESLRKTTLRLWDWGHENILPKEDYELIKDYINE